MEKINTETVLSSLFCSGFDKIDSILFTSVLGKVTKENPGKFECVDEPLSSEFLYYVTFNDKVFTLKNGLTLDSDVCELVDFYIPIRDRLITNEKLMKCLNKMDFKDIVLSKANSLNVTNLDQVDSDVFSSREIEILDEIFNKKKSNSLSKIRGKRLVRKML